MQIFNLQQILYCLTTKKEEKTHLTLHQTIVLSIENPYPLLQRLPWRYSTFPLLIVHPSSLGMHGKISVYDLIYIILSNIKIHFKFICCLRRILRCIEEYEVSYSSFIIHCIFYSIKDLGVKISKYSKQPSRAL